MATPSQYGALAAFTSDKGAETIAEMNLAYIERRNFVYERLIEMGLPVELPTGAFYIFPDISKFNKDSFAFAQDLLDKEHLAVVPGKAFSEFGEGHIRISFACTMEELEEGCIRLERYLEEIKS